MKSYRQFVEEDIAGVTQADTTQSIDTLPDPITGMDKDELEDFQQDQNDQE